MHEVLVNRLGGLSLPRKSVVRLTDRPDMTLDVYRGRKTTNQQNQQCPTNVIVGFYSAILRSKDADRITNRVDTDQTAPWGAVWSGSALFAQTYMSQYFKLVRYIINLLPLNHLWLSMYLQGLLQNKNESLIPNDCHWGETNSTVYYLNVLFLTQK